MSDLPELVDEHLAARFPDDRVCGWDVHRNLEDGSAAVIFRPGVLDTAAVRAQTLDGYATSLRDAGFTVDGETTWPEHDKPLDGHLLWLHVTAYAPPDGA